MHFIAYANAVDLPRMHYIAFILGEALQEMHLNAGGKACTT